MIWTQEHRPRRGRPLFTDAQLAAAMAAHPSQAAAARALGVSPAAVCKRLKRAARKCRRCATPMRPGIVMTQTMTGIGDFHDLDEVVTISPGGPGELVACCKCPACGWSVV